MGAVYRDTRSPGRTVFCIRYRDVSGRARRERTKALTKTLARRMLLDREDAVEKARRYGYASVDDFMKPAAPVTLREYGQEFLRGIQARRKEGTHERYEYAFRHIDGALGTKVLRQLTAGDLQRFFDQRLRDKASHASVYQERAVLNGIFREAMKEDLVAKSPMRNVVTPKVERKMVRFITEEEETRLVEAAREPLRSAIIAGINTGMRDSELRRVRWDTDVDMVNRTLIVRSTKSGRDRVLWINDTLYELLLRQPRFVKSPYVFTNPRSCEMYKSKFNNSQWKRVRRDTGIKARVHDWRHTTGSRLAQADVGETKIQAVLGHVSITTVQIYTHLRPVDIKDALSRLDKPKQNRSQA